MALRKGSKPEVSSTRAARHLSQELRR